LCANKPPEHSGGFSTEELLDLGLRTDRPGHESIDASRF
jgi:hypothetical protein